MRAAILGLATVVAVALFAVPASAGVNVNDRFKVSVTGSGAKKIGKEINISLLLQNTAVNPSVAPDRMKSFTIASPSVKWNRRGYRVKTCDEPRTTDGTSIKCSRSTRVGTGRFKAVFGLPGQSLFIYGALSEFAGTISVYNYKPDRGDKAMLMAEAKVTSPAHAAGTYFTVEAPVDRRGTIVVEIPTIAQLPPQIGQPLQQGTRAILTELTTKIKSPRTPRRGKKRKPYAALTLSKGLGATISVERED